MRRYRLVLLALVSILLFAAGGSSIAVGGDKTSATTLRGQHLPTDVVRDIGASDSIVRIAESGGLWGQGTPVLPSVVATPEVPFAVGEYLCVESELDASGDYQDYVELDLGVGDRMICWLYAPVGTYFDVYLMSPGDPDIDTGTTVSGWVTTEYPSGFGYTAEDAGTYAITVAAGFGAGEYQLYYDVIPAHEGMTTTSGDSRITTAVEVSKEAYPFGCNTVVIATGYAWPDALSGSALAGTVRGPILLTHSSYLDAEVGAEIQRLGATKAYIIGGEGAVSADVVEDLEAWGIGALKRLSGLNRYETCYEVAREVDTILEHGGDDTVTAFVVTGANFPDALAVGPISASYSAPVILEPPAAGVSPGTLGIIAEVGCVEAIIVGGEGVVDVGAQAGLEAALGEENVGRWYGANRYETAWVVSAVAVDGIGLECDMVAIASGENYADALAASMLQSTRTSVLLLSPKSVPSPVTCDWLWNYRTRIREVNVIGGLGAIEVAPREEYNYCAY